METLLVALIILCNTPNQVDELMGFKEAGIQPKEAIEMVNLNAKDDTACASVPNVRVVIMGVTERDGYAIVEVLSDAIPIRQYSPAFYKKPGIES